jgi:hypothetical protein
MLIFMPFWLFWGHFWTFFGGFRDFFVFFLGSVFLGHTSYKVAARAKKNVFSAFLVVSGGHFQAMLALGVAHFGRFLRYFTKKKQKLVCKHPIWCMETMGCA